jgi:2-isopropylmalate synthase
VGVREARLVLGKDSGRHALAKRCDDLGCALNREQLDTMYERFTALADRKKGLRNDEIAALAKEIMQERQPTAATAD